jgi:hypothetical protein
LKKFAKSLMDEGRNSPDTRRVQGRILDGDFPRIAVILEVN